MASRATGRAVLLSYTRGSNNVWPQSFAIYFIRENFPHSLSLSSVTGLLNRDPFRYLH